jgi:hypothetical protein
MARGNIYTDDEILKIMRNSYFMINKVPTRHDFNRNNGCVCYATIIRRFKTFENARRLAGIDIKLCNYDKGRQAELSVLNLPEMKNAVDVSGENANSVYDGIDENGNPYDVKSASLVYKNTLNSILCSWQFKFKPYEKSKYFICEGYDFKHENVIHRWKIPDTVINSRRGIIIPDNADSILKWSEYEITHNITLWQWMSNG